MCKRKSLRYEGLLLIIVSRLNSLTDKVTSIMANQTQTAQDIRDAVAKLDKAKAEIVARVQALEDAIANQSHDTSPEVDAAVVALREVADSLDSLNPDFPV